MTKRRKRMLLIMTQPKNEQQSVFKIGDDPQPVPIRKPKYDWHMVLNHTSPNVLTRIARNPYVNEPTMREISSTHYYMCRACMKGKLARSLHRRRERRHSVGEAFSTDILGPLQLPGVPTATERYFISFIDTSCRYAYVAQLTKRSQTGVTIQ